MTIKTMLPLGHLSATYLITKTIFSFFKFLSPKTKKGLLIFGTFITLLPDLDFIYPLFKFGTIFTKKSVFNHHATIFHSLFLWLLISLIIFLCSFLFSLLCTDFHGRGNRYIADNFKKQKLIRIIALIFFFSILTHLVLDSFFINSGPMWLWPFFQKTYGFIFTPSEISGFAGFLLYLSHPIFYLEILLSLITLIVILSEVPTEGRDEAKDPAVVRKPR